MGPLGTETEITMTKSELLALLFKLNRAESAKALIRRGEDGKDYYIRAIPDEKHKISYLHPTERSLIDKYFKDGN